MTSCQVTYICPGEAGYEFSPHDAAAAARFLKLLTPTPSELQLLGSVAPMLRADWLKVGWFAPRNSFLMLTGIRARLPASIVQRGSGSVWAVARVDRVATTPSTSALRPKFEELIVQLQKAIFATKGSSGFSNDTYRDLHNLPGTDLDAAFKSLHNKISEGTSLGVFN